MVGKYRRSRILNVRFSIEEMALVMMAADKLGLNTTAWSRMILLKAAASQLTAPTQQPTPIPEIVTQSSASRPDAQALVSSSVPRQSQHPVTVAGRGTALNKP